MSVGWRRVLCCTGGCWLAGWLSTVLCFSFLVVPSCFPVPFQSPFPSCSSFCFLVHIFLLFFSFLTSNSLVCWVTFFFPFSARGLHCCCVFVVLKLNLSFYPTTSVHPVSVLIFHPRDTNFDVVTDCGTDETRTNRNYSR